MTRNKVKLAWIVNDNARKSSFKKRTACLVKKMSELTTLCDINGFIIVHGEDGEEPTMWLDRTVVEQLIARFQSIPDLERWKKMMSQETYLKDSAAKMQEQIRKNMKKNNELNANNVLHQIIQKGRPLLEFDDNDLTGVVFYLEERMKEIRKRIDYFEQENPNHPPSTPSQWGGDQSEMISQIVSDFPESLLCTKTWESKFRTMMVLLVVLGVTSRYHQALTLVLLLLQMTWGCHFGTWELIGFFSPM